VQFGYGLSYLIDIESAVIVDVEATPARTYDEVKATKTMIERTEQRFDLKPKRLAADTALPCGRSDRPSAVCNQATPCQYGLINAVTRTAEDAKSYDRATELEMAGARARPQTDGVARPRARRLGRRLTPTCCGMPGLGRWSIPLQWRRHDESSRLLPLECRERLFWQG
jgi:hypothetical protein